jgi:hypothetical protein
LRGHGTKWKWLGTGKIRRRASVEARAVLGVAAAYRGHRPQTKMNVPFFTFYPFLPFFVLFAKFALDSMSAQSNFMFC